MMTFSFVCWALWGSQLDDEDEELYDCFSPVYLAVQSGILIEYALELLRFTRLRLNRDITGILTKL